MDFTEKEQLPLVRKRQFNPKLNQDLFRNLPPEIVVDILSRLPVRTVLICKCVCKSWMLLIETDEFVKCHLSKSTPGLAVYKLDSVRFQLFEFKDQLDLESHELHYLPVTEFNCKAFIRPVSLFDTIFVGSVDGLLLLSDNVGVLYICNLITHEYFKLRNEGFVKCSGTFPSATYGFGVSKMTGKYKVVRIYPDGAACWRNVKSLCQVYTLGMGEWRSITPLAQGYPNGVGAFINGNLHWLVGDSSWISCFDLETESFSTFSHPPLPKTMFSRCLVVLENCLCICVRTHNEIIIWMMKKYGDVKSWTKEFVISRIPDPDVDFGDIIYPIKIFRDGDILMTLDHYYMSYYHNKTKTTPFIDIDGLQVDGRDAMVYTPSFLSLKSFPKENVISF